MNKKNILDQKKQVNSSKSLLEPLKCGNVLVKSNVSERKAVIEDSYFPISSPKHTGMLKSQKKKSTVTAESPLPHKKKIWKDKLSSSDLNSLTTKLLGILDRESTLREKVLTPFWTQQSKKMSAKLWLPTKIDCVDSVLISSKESFPHAPMGKSWFSINKKHPMKKNSLATSFQSSQYSLPDSMDFEATLSRKKSELKQIKSLKIRLFPTQEEKKELQTMFDQFRWYYNAVITIVYNHYGYSEIPKKKKYSFETIRDLLRKYEYTEEHVNNLFFQDFVYDETRNENPQPSWWDKEPHSRIPRGAVNKFVSSLNSAISNNRAGHNKGFTMKFRSKKSPTDYLHFEDKGYPVMIKNIKSHYWFTGKNGNKMKMSFLEIQSTKGLEIIYEKETGKYFLHCPVPRNWFPKDDRRSDRQAKFIFQGERVIALDPGVRKFMVGYDPKGYSIFFGEGASLELTRLLYDTDNNPSYAKWKKIKNMVSELHWKTISFLIENYDTIILPDFRISQMIRKKKLAKITKRLLLMFSFHSFKEKLIYKCSTYKKKLCIVNESYTSCTCGVCGEINNVKGQEIYKCNKCKLVIDRDVSGSRNIFIKNTTLRLG
jgi:putative transposase